MTIVGRKTIEKKQQTNKQHAKTHTHTKHTNTALLDGLAVQSPEASPKLKRGISSVVQAYEYHVTA